MGVGFSEQVAGPPPACRVQTPNGGSSLDKWPPNFHPPAVHPLRLSLGLAACALHGLQVALHLQRRIDDCLRLRKCIPEDLNHFALQRDPPLIQSPGIDDNKSRLQTRNHREQDRDRL